MPRRKALKLTIDRGCCGHCFHWRPLEEGRQIASEDTAGECLRYPPVIVTLEEGTDEPMQAVPITMAQHRCGEHKPRMDA